MASHRPPLRGVFVTGTDTGVGKTAVAAALVCQLRAGGVQAVPCKPVQTGCRTDGAGRLVSPDLQFVLRAAGLDPAVARVWPCVSYAFRPPCSPHLAARQARMHIRIARIVDELHAVSAATGGFLVVEGAGGVKVPLGDDRSMQDLMVALGLPVVLVARPALGTLNHTLLSLDALRAARLPLAGVVVCQSQPGTWGPVEKDNLRVLQRLPGVPWLGLLRYAPGLAKAGTFAGSLRRAATGCLRDPGRLRRRLGAGA